MNGLSHPITDPAKVHGILVAEHYYRYSNHLPLCLVHVLTGEVNGEKVFVTSGGRGDFLFVKIGNWGGEVVAF